MTSTCPQQQNIRDALADDIASVDWVSTQIIISVSCLAFDSLFLDEEYGQLQEER